MPKNNIKIPPFYYGVLLKKGSGDQRRPKGQSAQSSSALLVSVHVAFAARAGPQIRLTPMSALSGSRGRLRRRRKPKKITPSLHWEREENRKKRKKGEDAKPAPSPAIKRQGFPLLTRWDSLAAAMLCITSSPSSSPVPLQPPRCTRAPSDRAAPPGISVSREVP